MKGISIMKENLNCMNKNVKAVVETYYEAKNYAETHPNVVPTMFDYLALSLTCKKIKDVYNIETKPKTINVAKCGIEMYEKIKSKEDEKKWLEVFGAKFKKKGKNEF